MGFFKVIQRKSRLFQLISLLVFSVTLISSADASSTKLASQQWVTSINANKGLPNFHRVNSLLYRSAQPTREGFAFLSRQPKLYLLDQPIKTVLSLRTFHDDSRFLPRSSPLRSEQIRFNTWHPEHEDILKFLRIVTTPELQPVLVHCQHGADRTGMMIAIYRIVVDGWTKEQAKAEMVRVDFGFHPIWQNLLHFIDDLDVDALKADLAKEGQWPS